MFKHGIRILLIYSLIIFVFGLPFFPVVRAQTTNGIGGGMIPDLTEFPEAPDFDLEMLFEAEEPFLLPHLTYRSYVMESGDIIGNIALMTGLNEDTLISVNDIRNTRLMQIGQVIRIPNQDGIYYTVQPGDTLESIAERYSTSTMNISIANEMFGENISQGERLFIPGGRMDWIARQEINGDLFLWPSIGRVTSPFGWRNDPFGSGRQFHTGIDIGGNSGNPVRAAMSGRVANVGYNNVYGNFVLINHHSGYRTLYAHMSTVRVRAGVNVASGETIGSVGSTGLSTGPHLHFSVFKDGVLVNPRALMR
ncbi:MAG: M23 family metallopeptidase [Treponema sp.]|nr:M23 family metallopeptidase [Treponema sp.]